MSLPIGRFTPYQALAASSLAANADRHADSSAKSPTGAGAVNQSADTSFGDVPPVPTPQARAAVDRAAARVDELADQNRELHFTHDEATNRLVVQVRDLDGNVTNTISPTKALDVMSGGEL
jgi:hypothetical protein